MSQDSSRPNFPQMEQDIALFWEKKKIFERSVDERSASKTFVFYDGPPFATGLPHYGHLLQSAIKDALPRYFTMKGYRVSRRWGWDCHGLPVENLIEKELNLNSKKDIESYGIDRFNAACRASVMTYASEWKKYVRRLGRWVDFDGAYRTMDATYIESVWWSFAELWEKKLIYQDLRVSFFCPRCSTPLSNFEIAMGNSYIDAEDPSVTLKFQLKGEEKTYMLVWTTTPWTLPANVALAVHPDQLYLKIKFHDTGETYIFAEALKASVLKKYFPLVGENVPFEVIEKVKGAKLVGREYEPLYPLLAADAETMIARPGKTQYRVIAMPYVSITDGTGIVHTAPAFGEEDFLASKTHQLPVLVTVDEEGRQKSTVPIGENLPILKSNSVILGDLERRGFVYDTDSVMHSVPVCWRCTTRLLYKAQPAWFVSITKLKSRMLKTAKKITWHPENFKAGRFGKGLETAPDWCISRTRYWGTPLPVWKCDACGEIRVFGSFKELDRARSIGDQTRRAIAQEKNEEMRLHRPSIDQVTVPCACGSVARRIPEVFDCWFESGSMPFASVQYPFKNKRWFDKHFPADFIAEAQDQTRGWFYSLHVLATALFNKPAFRDVIVTGMIMGEDGKKMSKSLKNYPDSWELMTTLGADTLRFYLLSSPLLQAEQLNFSERDCHTIQRTFLSTLWNVLAFYVLYSGRDRIENAKPRSTHVLDRWLMARLTDVTQEVTQAMDAYTLIDATRALRGWVDDLSTWWLRRSRERIKSARRDERLDALRTLHEALLQTSRLLAPFAPFFAERLYQDIHGPKMSVHLDRWPREDKRLRDHRLISDMQWIRDVTAAGHELRARAGMPVRQALSSLCVTVRDAAFAKRLSHRTDVLTVLREELNVERIQLRTDDVPDAEAWTVELDTKLTPELKKKGLARELSRQIMTLRKKEGLRQQDSIRAAIATSDSKTRDLLESVASGLMKDTRALSLDVLKELSADYSARAHTEYDGVEIRVGIKRSHQKNAL